MLDVTIEREALKTLSGREAISALRRATVRTLNEGLRAARTLAVRRTAEELGMSTAEARKRLLFSNASTKTLEATLRIGGRGVSLMAFKPKRARVQTRRGVRIGVTIQTLAGRRELVPGGFFVKLKSGKRGVFKRVGESRLPIKQLFAKLSPVAELVQREASDLTRVARATFERNFDRNFEHYVKTVIEKREKKQP
jgi:hypothetical protein